MGKEIEEQVAFHENIENSCLAQCCKRIKKCLQTYQGWSVVFVSAAMYIPVLGVLYNYNLLFVRLQEEFQSGAGETGWIGCLAIALLTLPSPLSSYLAEKITHRGIVALGIVMCSLGLLMTSFVTSIKYIFLTYSITFGLGTNFVQHPSLSLIVLYFNERKCAKATGLAITGTGAGIMATSYILEVLFNMTGWRGALRVSAAVIFPVGLVCCAFLKSPPPRPSNYEYAPVRNVDENTSSDQVGGRVYLEVSYSDQESKSFLRRYLLFLRTLDCWLVVFSYMGMGISVVFSYVNLASFMKTVGFSDHQAFTAISVMGGADLAGRLVITLLGGKLPVSVATKYILACLLGALPIMSLTVISSFAQVLVCYTVLSLTRSVTLCYMYAFCVDVFPSNAKVQGCTMAVSSFGVGSLLATGVGGMLYEASGSYNASFYVCASLHIIAVLFNLILLIRKRKRKRMYGQFFEDHPTPFAFEEVLVVDTYITTV